MNPKIIKKGMFVKIISNDMDVGFKIGTIGKVEEDPKLNSDSVYTFNVSANGKTWCLNNDQVIIAKNHKNTQRKN